MELKKAKKLFFPLFFFNDELRRAAARGAPMEVGLGRYFGRGDSRASSTRCAGGEYVRNPVVPGVMAVGWLCPYVLGIGNLGCPTGRSCNQNNGVRSHSRAASTRPH
jgi:hypothetical protein